MYTSAKHAMGDVARLFEPNARSQRTVSTEDGSSYVAPIDGGQGEQMPLERVAAYRLYLEVDPPPKNPLRRVAWSVRLGKIIQYATHSDLGEDRSDLWLEGEEEAVFRRWANRMRELGLIEAREPTAPQSRSSRHTWDAVDARTGAPLGQVTSTRTGAGSLQAPHKPTSRGLTWAGLKPLRHARGLSLRDLGALLRPPVSHVTVLHWETGRRSPTEDQVRQLAVVLRTTPERISGG